MPQQFLDRKNVHAIFQEVCGKSMTKGMDGHISRNTSCCKPFFQRVIDSLVRNARNVFPTGKKQSFRMIGPKSTPVVPQKPKALLGKYRITILVPFAAANEDPHLL